ncbi:RING-H2 finger protein ATL8-like [Castanea sativa]|uniref:RING-H2 finger protein ATL8-like n=1 Tax=Castanea sativa TaxID=21020 RepID=UPI003F651CFB
MTRSIIKRTLVGGNGTTTKITAPSPPTVVAAPPPEALTVESDFVVILAALLCALICVVGLIAVARCAWLRRGGTSTGSENRSPPRSLANKGVKKKVLQSLPKYTYGHGGSTKMGVVAGDGDGDGDGDGHGSGGECAICLGDFEKGEEIRVLPQCGHAFHVSCIDTWLASHSSCPSCRQILVLVNANAARCHKCGQFPASAINTIHDPPSHPPPQPQPQPQSDQTNFNAAAAATSSSSSSSSSFINLNIPSFLP